MSKRYRRAQESTRTDNWRDAPKKDVQVFSRAVNRVLAIVRAQFETFDRFVKLAALYDPNGWAALTGSQSVSKQLSAARDGALVIDNVIASNVDSTTGTLGAADVKPTFPTDGATWGVQRTMHHLGLYGEDLRKHLGLHPMEGEKLHEAALKGTGVVKVEINRYREVVATAPEIDDVIVDEGSLQPDGWPMDMYQRHRIDRDELAAQHPDHRAAIMSAPVGRLMGGDTTWWSRYVDDGRLMRNQLGVLEGYYRAVGRKGKPGYKPGRHFVAIDGHVLLDDEYEEDYFPFARMVWQPRYGCWYGIGGAERITGHQRRLNKHNWQFDAQLDSIARPTTFVRPIDAALNVQDRTAAGTTAVYRGDLPHTVIPTAVSPEQYRRDEVIHQRSFENFGQSRMAATSMKPAGIDSGVALREYKDQSSDRFASQEQRFEAFKLRTTWLGLMCCKKLGKDAPSFQRTTTYGTKLLTWSKVDPKDARVRMQAASTLSSTPAGRKQFAMELAQGGVISTDEARILLEQPDIERSLSLYTAALRNIERCLEDMLDGYIVMPHPMMNLKMCVWRGQAQLNLSEMDNAPEDVLENIRQFVVVAAHYLKGQEQPGMAAGAMGGMQPALPGTSPALPPVGAELQSMGGPPMATPTTALAPQLMLAPPA